MLAGVDLVVAAHLVKDLVVVGVHQDGVLAMNSGGSSARDWKGSSRVVIMETTSTRAKGDIFSWEILHMYDII